MISCRLSSSSTGQALSHVSRGLFCRAGVREVGTKTGRADVLVDISRVLGGSSHPLRPTGTATHGDFLQVCGDAFLICDSLRRLAGDIRSSPFIVAIGHLKIGFPGHLLAAALVKALGSPEGSAQW